MSEFLVQIQGVSKRFGETTAVSDAGIDPVLRRKFWNHFCQLKDEGKTLFVTTQYVGEAAYCDYVGVMLNGRLLMVEKPGDLRRRALGGEIVNVHTTVLLSTGSLLAFTSFLGCCQPPMVPSCCKM